MFRKFDRKLRLFARRGAQVDAQKEQGRKEPTAKQMKKRQAIRNRRLLSLERQGGCGLVSQISTHLYSLLVQLQIDTQIRENRVLKSANQWDLERTTTILMRLR